MQKTIKLKNKIYQYKLIKTKRAKRINLSIKSDATIVLSMPKYLPFIYAQNFLKKKADWLIEKIENIQKNNSVWHLDKNDYQKQKTKALELVYKKVEKFNKVYNFKFNKVSVKNQKTRWGSCSSQKNLNFNYRIIYLPEKLVDYIIVHELCHLKEMNHSKNFWDLVKKVLPDYLSLRKMLKKESLLLR